MQILWKPSASRTLVALALVVVIDVAALSVAMRAGVYPPLNVAPRYAPLAYVPLAMALGGLQAASPLEAAAGGALVGALVYGTFNGTELALRDDWRTWYTPAFDFVYGTLLCAIVAAVVARAA